MVLNTPGKLCLSDTEKLCRRRNCGIMRADERDCVRPCTLCQCRAIGRLPIIITLARSEHVNGGRHERIKHPEA